MTSPFVAFGALPGEDEPPPLPPADGAATGRATGQRPAHRSVSQLGSFIDCGMRYRLERVDQVDQRPAWWNAGGTALHSVIELWERARLGGRSYSRQWAAGQFAQELDNEAGRLERTSGVPASEWRVAARGREDRLWWLVQGALMVEHYVMAQQQRTYEIAMLTDGRPGIEVEFLAYFGAVPVRGFVDQVIRDADGRIGVRDLKSGATAPVGSIQLPTYAHAMVLLGLAPEVAWADYWLARKGAPSAAVNLARYPLAAVEYQVGAMDHAERAGVYLPRLSDLCRACSVKAACPTQTGQWPDGWSPRIDVTSTVDEPSSPV